MNEWEFRKNLSEAIKQNNLYALKKLLIELRPGLEKTFESIEWGNIFNSEIISALHGAILNKNPEMVALIMQHCSENILLIKSTSDLLTPVVFAARNSTACLEALLDVLEKRKKNIHHSILWEAKCDCGEAIYYFMLDENYDNQNLIPIIERLLKFGASVEIKGNGLSLLHLAIKRGREDWIRLLIQYGVPLGIKSKAGQTPAQYFLEIWETLNIDIETASRIASSLKIDLTTVDGRLAAPAFMPLNNPIANSQNRASSSQGRQSARHVRASFINAYHNTSDPILVESCKVSLMNLQTKRYPYSFLSSEEIKNYLDNISDAALGGLSEDKFKALSQDYLDSLNTDEYIQLLPPSMKREHVRDCLKFNINDDVRMEKFGNFSAAETLTLVWVVLCDASAPLAEVKENTPTYQHQRKCALLLNLVKIRVGNPGRKPVCFDGVISNILATLDGNDPDVELCFGNDQYKMQASEDFPALLIAQLRSLPLNIRWEVIRTLNDDSKDAVANRFRKWATQEITYRYKQIYYGLLSDDDITEITSYINDFSFRLCHIYDVPKHQPLLKALCDQPLELLTDNNRDLPLEISAFEAMYTYIHQVSLAPLPDSSPEASNVLNKLCVFYCKQYQVSFPTRLENLQKDYQALWRLMQQEVTSSGLRESSLTRILYEQSLNLLLSSPNISQEIRALEEINVFIKQQLMSFSDSEPEFYQGLKAVCLSYCQQSNVSFHERWANLKKDHEAFLSLHKRLAYIKNRCLMVLNSDVATSNHQVILEVKRYIDTAIKAAYTAFVAGDRQNDIAIRKVQNDIVTRCSNAEKKLGFFEGRNKKILKEIPQSISSVPRIIVKCY